MTERLNITDLAIEFHMSNGRASNLLRQAGIERDASKRYDAEDARTVLAEAIDPAKASGNRIAGRAEGAVSPAIAELAAAKVRSEAARAERIEIDNRLRAGKLVERSSVVAAGEDFATTVRNALLGIPAKLAARLVGKTREDIVTALDAEIRHALTSLADIDNFLLGAP